MNVNSRSCTLDFLSFLLQLEYKSLMRSQLKEPIVSIQRIYSPVIWSNLAIWKPFRITRVTKVIRICSFPIGSILDNYCLCLSAPCQGNSIIDTATQARGILEPVVSSLWITHQQGALKDHLLSKIPSSLRGGMIFRFSLPTPVTMLGFAVKRD